MKSPIQNAMVFGATSAIATAFCRILAKHGARLHLIGREEEPPSTGVHRHIERHACHRVASRAYPIASPRAIRNPPVLWNRHVLLACVFADLLEWLREREGS